MTTLVYTVAVDSDGAFNFTSMAKILSSTLLRTYFTGEILIFHNAPEPIYRVQRSGLREIMLPPDTQDGKRLKFQVRDLIDAEKYDWVCFLDCDMLAQRNIDHLFSPNVDCDILWQPELTMKERAYNSYFHPEEFPHLWRRGANSGSFAVRGVHYNSVMSEWERIDDTAPVTPKILVDQPAWNRLLFDTKLRTQPFERDEIQFPLLHDHDYRKWRNAALLHANGTNAAIKLEFLLGQYLGRTIGDAKTALALLDM